MSSNLWKMWRLKGKFHSLEMTHRGYCYMNSLQEFQIMDFFSEHICLYEDGRLETGLQSPVKEAKGPSLVPNAQENFSDEEHPCRGTLALLYLEKVCQICPHIQHPADPFSGLTSTRVNPQLLAIPRSQVPKVTKVPRDNKIKNRHEFWREKKKM